MEGVSMTAPAGPNFGDLLLVAEELERARFDAAAFARIIAALAIADVLPPPPPAPTRPEPRRKAVPA
jgi:hypothetical protein